MLEILRLVLREKLSRQNIPRKPEPSSLMQEEHNVEGFHAEGSDNGALIPLYHFNARAMSHLMPPGGTLLDLGSGSGQFLRHLARCRPDIQIIGMDLSEPMVRLGNRSLNGAGLGNRVVLRSGDMTQFSSMVPSSIDVISSIFSLHHLPTIDDFEKCCKEIRHVRSTTSCAVWLFDHARPRHRRTLEEFPEIFTPASSLLFKQDSRNSLEASWSFDELCRTGDRLLGRMNHELARVLPLYQIHWVHAAGRTKHGDDHWLEPELSKAAKRDHARFSRLFPKVGSELLTRR